MAPLDKWPFWGYTFLMNFPNTKIGAKELTFYKPIQYSLTAGLLCPWPIKMGEPTLSVIRFHSKACGAAGANNNDPCRCPRWKAYLRAELRRAEK